MNNKEINGKIKIICVGDSITYGFGVEPYVDTQSYPAILGDILGDKYEVLNLGVNARALLSNSDMPYFETEEGKYSLGSHSDIILFMLGTNDSKDCNWQAERFAYEYLEVIEHYKTMPNNPNIYLLVPPRSFQIPEDRYMIRDSIIKNEIKPIISRISEKLDTKFIDLYNFTQEHPEWFMDQIHPTYNGYKYITQYIYENLDLE